MIVALGGILLVMSLYWGFNALRGFQMGMRRISNDIHRLSRGDLSEGDPMSKAPDIRAIRMELRGLREGMASVAASGKAVANGDLTCPIAVLSKDDEMGNSLEDMRQRLCGALDSARMMITGVSFGSDTMNDLATQMNSGTHTQAAATEQLRATLEQISSAVKETSENASQTEQIAHASAEDATKTSDAVQNTVKAMSDINDKVGIVQELARQTDLLALNASVEAARAGEHGKGFAVVAAEVRKLAERSQEAATDISGVAQHTSTISNEAGALLEALVPKIKQTAALVQTIAAEMHSQNHSFSETRQAMTEINDVIQRLAGQGQTTSDTSAQLAESAHELEQLFAFFRTDGSGQAPTIDDRASMTSDEDVSDDEFERIDGPALDRTAA